MIDYLQVNYSVFLSLSYIQDHLVRICLEIVLTQARTGKPPVSLHLWKIMKLIPVREWKIERVPQANLSHLHGSYCQCFILVPDPTQWLVLTTCPSWVSFPNHTVGKIIFSQKSKELCLPHAQLHSFTPKVCILFWGHGIISVHCGNVFLGPSS